MSCQEMQILRGVQRLVRLEAGAGGLSRLVIDTPRAQAQLYLHGAHLTHYQPAGHRPVLFMSSKSEFVSGKPIRGGVPICFPWFGPHRHDSSLPAHGLARLRSWTLTDAHSQDDGSISITLLLVSDEQTRKLWPFDFRAWFTVVVGERLQMSLTVENPGSSPIEFEQALHTYLAIGDIHQVGIEGLAGTEYLDKTRNLARLRQDQAVLRFTEETDRVYFDTESTCSLIDPVWGRRIVVEKEGSKTTVIWNPWINKSRALPDFGDDEWPGMVCIETCNAGPNPVKLSGGDRHTMVQTVSVEAGLFKL